MAAVLDAMAPYVMKLITDMAQEEVSTLLGVSGEITKLKDNTEGLKAFLADAERRRLTDKSVQRWVWKLKGAMYDAIDILDLCQLEADKRKESNGGGGMEHSNSVQLAGCFRPLLFCLRNPVFAHKVGSRIKKLNQRLEGIYKEADRFKFINIGLGFNPELERPIAAERSTSEFDESAIVGEKIEKDTRELARLLTTTSSGHDDIKVVSIVGTGGMGKTTLAQKIFNDTAVQEHFKLKIWLSITQDFDPAELLRTTIKHAGGHHDGEQDKTLLTRTLTETLSMGRFLLVLDDMWGDEAWKNVLRVPAKKASKKQQGSWVLITTRREDLAQRMGASFYQHHVIPLDEEDAWSLLNKQLPPSQVLGIDKLKGVGMRIIERCGGLPLAIKVMGGLLSTRYPSESAWNAVLNNPAWSMVGLPEELNIGLYLSYEDLSPQLKQCFLYCSLLPKGTTIWRLHVTSMWISEGYIQRQDESDERLEELAAEYYRELIIRNLIEPESDSHETSFSCTMHDVVRSFAEFVAKGESLVVHDVEALALAGTDSNSSVLRRLSLGPTTLVPTWSSLQKQESLRTLVICCSINFMPEYSMISFSSLRVLYVRRCAGCDRLVDSLCQLRHLRFLHFEETDISRLPEDIHSLKFLQHIVLIDCKNLDSLPNSIIQLVHLRSLSMPRSNVKFVPKGLGGLTNLRMLMGFPVHMDTDGGWFSLEEIGPLSQLRCLTLHNLDNVSACSNSEKDLISSKRHLIILELYCNENRFIRSTDEADKQHQQQRIEEVFDKLCPSTSIEHLHIKGGYFGSRLPNWMMAPGTVAFRSLMCLVLEHLICCTQLPDGLCQLPSLVSLRVLGAPAIRSVGPEFQGSVSLALGGDGPTATSETFPKLKNLHLHDFSEWDVWRWEEQYKDMIGNAISMPALEFLCISDNKLSCLPPGLTSSKRQALRTLNIYSMKKLLYVDNFPSVIDLKVSSCTGLRSISGLSKLQKIQIINCPNVQVLEHLPELDSLELADTIMETLPGYLRCINPRYLKLTCNKKLGKSLFPDSSEWDKIKHIRKRNICYDDSDVDSREH
ncbi:hypothetical protein U9M48_020355 [Paspalum notatum var. saurae]|uniref:Uncharacterized protein n=1 Tax=Paspalum notatum var. saurae TaxID=547442 RepID=A0AAQ3TEM4_PASNO